MIKTAVIFILLSILWLEPTFGITLSELKGISLKNFALLMLFMGLVTSAAFEGMNLRWNRIYLYIIGLIFVFIVSIPLKFTNDMFRHVILRTEIISLKNYLEPYILFFLIFNFVNNKQVIKNAVFGLMVFLMLTVVATLLVATDVFTIGRMYTVRDSAWPIYAEPNQFAAYLVLISPLFFLKTISVGSGFSRIVSAICCVLILLSLIASASRGGLLGFCICTIAYLLLKKGTGKKTARGVVTGALVIIALVSVSLFTVPSWLKERTTSRLEYKSGMDIDEYSSGRLAIWKRAMDVFMERPSFFGLGLSGYSTLLKQRIGRTSDCHNMYLQQLVDHGIIGFTLFLALIIGLLKGCLKGRQNTSDDFGSFLFLSFFSGMLGFSVAIIFVDIYQYFPMAMIYAALVLKYAQLDSEERIVSRQIHNFVLKNGLEMV